MKRDMMWALWLRGCLQLFFPVLLVALQSVLPGPTNIEAPVLLFKAVDDNAGDFFSEVFKVYGFSLCALTFALMLVLAARHKKFSQVYKAQRIAVFANELARAYKVPEEETMAKMA